MEQAMYTMMWGKRKQGFMSSNLQVAQSHTSAYDDDGSNWEEEAFAKDTAGNIGGCIWPPRQAYYSCNFCRRQFRSAQALGGHMNVHRRDRARLKQSSSSINPNNIINPLLATVHQYASSHVCALVYKPNPNPNPNSDDLGFISSTTSPSTNISISTPFKENCNNPQQHQRLRSTTISSTSIQYSWSNMDDSALVGCNKRRKIDTTSSKMSSFLKPSPVVVDTYSDQSDKLFKFTPLNSLDELDLELRLGNRPKKKKKN